MRNQITEQYNRLKKAFNFEGLMSYTPEQIAGVLDYAHLNPIHSPEDIKDGAIYATNNHIKSYCVASGYVGIASHYHDNVSSVIAFPHGNMDSEAKLREAERAVLFGARELDIVVSYGRFLDGDLWVIQAELGGIVDMAHDNGVLVKAILETCYYSPSEIRQACEKCVKAEVDFVVSSTDFGTYGATVEDVQVMLDAVKGTNVGVKASGGIHCYADVVKFLDMGCKCIGANYYKNLLP